MPKVPVIQENQRLNANRPSGFQSTGQFRRMGDAVSGFGKGVQNLAVGLNKAKSVNKTLARKDAQNRVDDALGELYTEQERNGFSPEAKATYEKNKKKKIAEINKELNTKYGDGFANDIEVFGRDREEAWDQRFGTLDNGQLVNHTKKEMKNVEAQFVTKAFSYPGMLDDAVLNANETFEMIGSNLGMSNEKKDEASRVLTKTMVLAAIDGHMESGDRAGYTMAKALVKSKYSQLFSQEERKAIFKDIKDTQRSSIRWENSQEDREARLEEAELNKSQELATTNLAVEMQQASESGQVRKIMKTAAALAKRGNLTHKHLGKLATRADKSYKVRDNESKFSIRSAVYNGDLDKDFVKGRAMVQRAVTVNGTMLPETGAALMKEFDQMQKKFDSDPVYKQKYKAAQSLMKKILGDESMIESIIKEIDVAAGKTFMNRIHGARQLFHQTIAQMGQSGRPVDPMQAAVIALDTIDYDKVLSQVVVPNAPVFAPQATGGKPSMQEVQDYIAKGEYWLESGDALLMNPVARSMYERQLNRFRTRLEVMKKIGEYEDMKTQQNIDNTLKIQGLDNQPPANIEEDVDGLSELDEHGVPFMLRLQPPEY